MTSAHPPSVRPAATADLRAHQQWLGYVQPVGLVVSLPALQKAQCNINRNVVREQQALLALVEPKDKVGVPTSKARLADFRALCRDSPRIGRTQICLDSSDAFDVALPEYNEVLKPTYVVPSSDKATPVARQIVQGIALDKTQADTGWQASPQARFERLLRENDVPVGILFNGTQVRLVYAPRGESSGHVTFDVLPMCEPAGRPILGAMHMLLSQERMFALEESQRLPAILKDSRRYQNEVSTKLSEQVLGALYELLRGFRPPSVFA